MSCQDNHNDLKNCVATATTDPESEAFLRMLIQSVADDAPVSAVVRIGELLLTIFDELVNEN